MNRLYGYDSFGALLHSGCGGLVRVGLRLGLVWVGLGLGLRDSSRFMDGLSGGVWEMDR